jgi:hypothetical protein
MIASCNSVALAMTNRKQFAGHDMIENVEKPQRFFYPLCSPCLCGYFCYSELTGFDITNYNLIRWTGHNRFRVR